MRSGYRFEIRCTPEVRERLWTLADRAGVTPSELVRQLVVTVDPETLSPTRLEGGSLAEAKAPRERETTAA